MRHFVSTPSRICLFGEHQDYLGLEVVAVAINLRFSAAIARRDDKKIHIRIRDAKIDRLGDTNEFNLYEEYWIDLEKPIIYENNRDYLKSGVNVLIKEGYLPGGGFDIVMDSKIPIGKGMCSSSTMIVALIKSILEAVGSSDSKNAFQIAQLAFAAEVLEFNEPGGMMDHLTSAIGGLVHLDFANGQISAKTIPANIPGRFILIDSLRQKNTTQVLASAKAPTLEAIGMLKPYGIRGIRDFIENEDKLEYLDKLDGVMKEKLAANIDNYRILKEGLRILGESEIDMIRFGELLYAHHKNLRDGLGVSTRQIEDILDTAIGAGAIGGKINGSGGGGCVYVYAEEDKVPAIIEAVNKMGYPGMVLSQDIGVSLDKCEEDGIC